MRAAIAAVLLVPVCVLGACKSGAPAHPGPDPAQLAELDALWALAPADARGGIAISPRGIAMLEGGIASMQELFAIAPDLVEHRRHLDKEIGEALGTTTLTRAELGLAKDRGAAIFFLDGGPIAVLALADRDRFLKHTHGAKGADGDRVGDMMCKPLRDRYACAKSADRIDALGKGSLKAQLSAAGARGDIEITGDSEAIRIAAAVQLARGAVTVRGTAQLKRAAELLTKLATPPVKPRLSAGPSSGFAVANVTRLVQGVPPLPLGETTLEAVARSLEGPLTLSVPSGPLGFELQQALADPGPVRALLDHCDGLLAVANVKATSGGGVCRFSIPAPALEIEASVDGKMLRIGTHPASAPAPGKAVPMTALGSELAAGDWTFAAWGRGAIFGVPGLREIAQHLGGRKSEKIAAVVHAIAMLNELGVGVRVDGDTVRFVAGARTGFANPDVVVAQLSALTAAKILDGSAADTMRRVAASRPQSPLAADLDAGAAGYVSMAAVGALAGAALWATFESRREPEPAEPEPLEQQPPPAPAPAPAPTP